MEKYNIKEEEKEEKKPIEKFFTKAIRNVKFFILIKILIQKMKY